MAYRHTQSGWMMRIAFAICAIGFVVMTTIEPFASPVPRGVLVAGAALFAVLGIAWSRLTIEIDDERARWWFGLGWPRGTLLLAEIADVATTRTTFWQGWGIHHTRKGWLYNVAGYDAVLITRRDGRRLMLGSDEPRRLKAAFDRALARAPHDRIRA